MQKNMTVTLLSGDIRFRRISATQNDLEWLFRVKFGFRAGLAGSDRVTFEK